MKLVCLKAFYYICIREKHLIFTLMDNKKNTSQSGMMTTRQAADYLHTSRDNVYKMASRGQIPSYKPVGRLYFDRSELDSWMRGGK